MQSFDWQGTVESCRRTLKSDPNHLGALETMAHALWFGGQYSEVILTTSRLLRLNPNEPGYRYTRGMALMTSGDLVSAHEDFVTAIAQSDNTEFRAQVSASLDALERWMIESRLGGSRFSSFYSDATGTLH